MKRGAERNSSRSRAPHFFRSRVLSEAFGAGACEPSTREKSGGRPREGSLKHANVVGGAARATKTSPERDWRDTSRPG